MDAVCELPLGPVLVAEEVDDAPCDDRVCELPEVSVAPRVEVAASNPKLLDAEGHEVFAAVKVERDVAVPQDRFDLPLHESFHVQTVELELAV